MKLWQKIALTIGGSAILGWAAFAHAAVSQCFQGGTGIGSATSGQVGYILQISTTSPFCGYSLTPPTGAGVSTTTINGVQGPLFTFSIVATTSASSFTTSSANIFLNLLRYSSSSDITITSTGTLVFASHNISQFTNDSGYIKFAPATSTITAGGGTATGPAFTFSTSTASNQFKETCALANCTSTIPSNVGFFTNDSGYQTTSSVNVTSPITGSGSAASPLACASCLTTNQTITVSNTGDVTSTGSGATSITLPSHVVAIQGFSVATATPSNGQVLQYVTSTNMYVPSTLSFGGTTINKTFFSTTTAISGTSLQGIATTTLSSAATTTYYKLMINLYPAPAGGSVTTKLSLGGTALFSNCTPNTNVTTTAIGDIWMLGSTSSEYIDLSFINLNTTTSSNSCVINNVFAIDMSNNPILHIDNTSNNGSGNYSVNIQSWSF